MRPSARPQDGTDRDERGAAASLVKGGLSQRSACRELHRAEMARFRKPTPPVVEALSIVELGGSGFIVGAVHLVWGPFGLRR